MNIAYSNDGEGSKIEALYSWAREHQMTINRVLSNESNLQEMIMPNDTLIVKNIYEINENPQHIFRFMKYCVDNNVIIYSMDDDYCFDTQKSKEMRIIVDLFAKMSEFRYSKARTALQTMKSKGERLGRTKGSTVKLNKIKKKKDLIIKDIENGLSLNQIYKKYKVSRTTVSKLRELESDLEQAIIKRLG